MLTVRLDCIALDSEIFQPSGSLLKLALTFFFFNNIVVNTLRLMLPRRGDEASVCDGLIITTVTADVCRTTSIRWAPC